MSFVLELVFEGIEDIGTDRKVKKWIRIPLLVLIILFYLLIVSVLFICAIAVFKTNIVVSLILFAITAFMLWGAIGKFKSIYCRMKNGD